MFTAIQKDYRQTRPVGLATNVLTIILLSAASMWSAVQPIKLIWDPSLSPSVVDHKVYWSRDPNMMGPLQGISVGNTNQCTLNVGTAGQTLYFAVTAADALGLESEFSNIVSALIKHKQDEPSGGTDDDTGDAIDPDSLDGTGSQSGGGDEQVEPDDTGSGGTTPLSFTKDPELVFESIRYINGFVVLSYKVGSAGTYEIQKSDDGLNWVATGVVFPADGPDRYQVSIASDGQPQMYFRVIKSP